MHTMKKLNNYIIEKLRINRNTNPTHEIYIVLIKRTRKDSFSYKEFSNLDNIIKYVKDGNHISFAFKLKNNQISELLRQLRRYHNDNSFGYGDLLNWLDDNEIIDLRQEIVDAC